MQAVIGSWHRTLIPAIVREGITLRMAIGGAFFLASLTVWLAIAGAAPSVAACTGGMSVLLYPQYSSKGIIMDHERSCGRPHRGCRKEGEYYVCSPFMRPQG